MKGRQFLARLRALGVEIDVSHGKGGHVEVKHQGRKSFVKMHGAKDLSNNYIRLVCRQLGIDPNEI